MLALFSIRSKIMVSMSEFLYRPLLRGTTEVAKTQGLDPYEAYAWLYEQAKEQDLHAETYASTAITSGGHKRDDSLDLLEVITRNTESARLLAEQLAADGQIDARSTIEPVYVGKTGWSQAEYMEFWLAVIAGAQLTKDFSARDVDRLRTTQRQAYDVADVDFDCMNSGETAEARAGEYFRMAAASADSYQTSGEIHPVQQLVRLIDADLSLGAQAERVFARQLGIRVLHTCVVRPVAPAALETVNPHLAHDAQRLITFGATVFDTANKQTRLMLIDEVA